MRGGELIDRGALGQIKRLGGDADVVTRSDLLARRLEISRRALHQNQITALLGQRAGNGAADTLGGAGDQGGAAGEFEIHGNVRWLLGAKVL